MEIEGYLAYLLVAFGYCITWSCIFLAIQGGSTIGLQKTTVMLFGNTVGLGILAFISALGLGAWIVNSVVLSNITKVIGASWLFYLGLKMIRSHTLQTQQSPEVSMTDSHFDLFRDGLLLPLTNPKPIIFLFLSILNLL